MTKVPGNASRFNQAGGDMVKLGRILLLVAGCGVHGWAGAQGSPLKVYPTPASQDAPLSSHPAQTVEDARTHVRLELPAGWELSRKDGELSTFRFDARTALPKTQLRLVAGLDFNPYPRSTFSGALFYLSMTPHSTEAACAAQATRPPMHALGTVQIGDVSFTHGHDEHGRICTEARDEVFTALQGGSCVRFDLTMNTFCGGDVSGAEDMTALQINAIDARFESILHSVRFTLSH